MKIEYENKIATIEDIQVWKLPNGYYFQFQTKEKYVSISLTIRDGLLTAYIYDDKTELIGGHLTTINIENSQFTSDMIVSVVSNVTRYGTSIIVLEDNLIPLDVFSVEK